MSLEEMYFIGMAITIIILFITAVREKIFVYNTLSNIIIAFILLVLWPLFILTIIILMNSIYKPRNKKENTHKEGGVN